MVKNTNILKSEYKNYKDPVNKISRLIKNGFLLQLTKGVYEDDSNVEPFYIAQVISSPSYISFEAALSYHGLIPERTYVVTCASLNKKKTKIYRNKIATYTYSDIPSRVFALGIELIEENGYSYHIATKEKALCDKLYKLQPINNYNELEITLFSDLRIDKDSLNSFNINDMKIYSDLYHSTNITLLYKYLRRQQNDNSN